MHTFRVTAIWNKQFRFGSPCIRGKLMRSAPPKVNFLNLHTVNKNSRFSTLCVWKKKGWIDWIRHVLAHKLLFHEWRNFRHCTVRQKRGFKYVNLSLKRIFRKMIKFAKKFPSLWKLLINKKCCTAVAISPQDDWWFLESCVQWKIYG